MWICGYMQIWWSMLQSLERWHFFTPKSPKTKTEIWNLGKAVQKTASIFITTHLFILAATKFLHYSIPTSPHSIIPPILYIQYICSFKCMSMSVVEVYKPITPFMPFCLYIGMAGPVSRYFTDSSISHYSQPFSEMWTCICIAAEANFDNSIMYNNFVLWVCWRFRCNLELPFLCKLPKAKMGFCSKIQGQRTKRKQAKAATAELRDGFLQVDCINADT